MTKDYVMKTLLKLAIIASLLPALAWAQGAPGEAPAAPVEVETAQRSHPRRLRKPAHTVVSEVMSGEREIDGVVCRRRVDDLYCYVRPDAG